MMVLRARMCLCVCVCRWRPSTMYSAQRSLVVVVSTASVSFDSSDGRSVSLSFDDSLVIDFKADCCASDWLFSVSNIFLMAWCSPLSSSSISPLTADFITSKSLRSLFNLAMVRVVCWMVMCTFSIWSWRSSCCFSTRSALDVRIGYTSPRSSGSSRRAVSSSPTWRNIGWPPGVRTPPPVSFAPTEPCSPSSVVCRLSVSFSISSCPSMFSSSACCSFSTRCRRSMASIFSFSCLLCCNRASMLSDGWLFNITVPPLGACSGHAPRGRIKEASSKKEGHSMCPHTRHMRVAL
mmetsp:Transcript_39152/g.87650  ORF Transcript_39152/g.87650 Transcript_39152/m.87650 type:complete len:293 (+) Transcript_39152:53-931(+)